MTRIIEKVTAFVTRDTGQGHDLLLFEHPHAGIQIPAGTVEPGETPEDAALREVAEETGLGPLAVHCYLGCVEEKLPAGQRIIAEPTRVYARPDRASFDWAYIRAGIAVAVRRRASGFSQITYQEFDRVPEPQYVTLRITGWVPDETLADTRRRHFWHLVFDGRSAERWSVHADNHVFRPFWAPLDGLPPIIPPQDRWLDYLPGVAHLNGIREEGHQGKGEKE
jgi:8-oxo-dGTP pyrophosphatase MutT (NUDIX family)